jgi:DNA-binding LacI/PurR family transcriptional regulator
MATSLNNNRSETTGRRSRGPSRVGKLRDQLRELAVSKGPGYKLPSVRDICAQFDTNWITLRSALDELEADRVIERRQGSGVYVSPKLDCKRIHIIMDSRHFQKPGASPFWGMLSYLLLDEAQNRVLVRNEEHRFHMVMSHPRDPSYHEQVIQDIERTGIAAVLLIGRNEPIIDWLDASGIPCVSYAAGTRYRIVNEDTCFIEATGVLVERGCRRIGVWWPSPTVHPSHAERTAPYRTAYERLGIVYNPDWTSDVVPFEEGGHDGAFPSSQEQGYRLAREMFGAAGGTKPDGLVIHDDMMTFGALVALAELGIEPGRDILIASGANVGSPVLFGQEKRLILLEMDPHDIVASAFEMLDAVLKDPDAPEREVVVPWRIRG